jgi:diguanylate cyclase (GGDEF)-like protein
LAYLAPEQTGRTDRPVDERADLYALGATLYELATGAPPFGTGDPLRLCHDHLARLPRPPAQVNYAVPTALSDVIMRLLEKEPDQRYQTADGLLQDLVDVRDGRSFHVAERDFPLRLLAPSRLIGRDGEIAALGAAFARSLTGRCHAVLVSGEPGVGKTSLVGELRPIVTACGGWFVAGKFDRHRRDGESNAVSQAFRALGRLLLAEPEEELAKVRGSIMRAVGPHAGLVAAANPELAVLLGVAPVPTGDDMLMATIRLQRVGLELLRAVASPKRPIVLVIDDLQWAGRTPMGFVDAVLSDDDLEGVLLVAAYREDEVDAAHPLGAMLSRWRSLETPPEHIRLGNLPKTSHVALLAEMLRVDLKGASTLAVAIEPRSRGNPYDTVELVNALRRDGALVPRADGWHWQMPTVEDHLGRADVIGLLVARLAAMPSRTQDMLEAMACLGSWVDAGLLQAATGRSPTTVEDCLKPALEDGLLVLEPGQTDDAIRFRHDRVQEAVLGRLAPVREYDLRIDLARRLSVRPELATVAAEQYLRVIDAVRDPQECRLVVDVFRRASDQALLLSNCAVVERLLAGALRLVDPAEVDTVIEFENRRLAALYSLGRLDEAEEAYHRVERLSLSPLQRTSAALVQVSNLTNRGRRREALALGLDLLRQLGMKVPSPDELSDEIERGLAVLYRWLDEGDADADLRRPETTDQVALADAALVNRLMPPAFFSDQPMMTWLALRAVEAWAEHGPGRTLVGPCAHVGFVTAMLRRDYQAGRRAMLRLLAVSEARGYEPDTSQARFLYALGTGHWFEPLDENVLLAKRAREELIKGGDLQNACFTYYIPVQQYLEYAPTLEAYIAEVEAALEFTARTGNDHAAKIYRVYRWVAGTLRGEPVEPVEPVSDEAVAADPVYAANVQISRALIAAIFDDPLAIERHTTAAMPLLPLIVATHPTVIAYLLRALDLAGRARTSAPTERAALLADLDAVLDWLASRARDAPGNFLHLVRLIEAERAWSQNDFWGAAQAFDAAQRAVELQGRPWHRALILERTARFHLATGAVHTGHVMLGQARQAYEAWGATAKVMALDRAYPELVMHVQPASVHPIAPAPASIMAGAIDLLGILDASRALSSETTIDTLRARVINVLTAMTGASTVHLAIWNDEQRSWLLPASGAADVEIAVDERGASRLVPMSAIRYAQRTREPLVVPDAKLDDRLARDSYFTGLDTCSLLVVPIINRGMLRAMLVLENRLIRGAFSAQHLDGVLLIAGQLAVSLDNASLYASLERKVAERTEALAKANQRLEQLSFTDSLTGMANRRRLEEVLDEQWHRAQHTGTSLAVAMVDIDRFKRYNDHFGHLAGDQCLQRVAKVLRSNVHDVDLAARYGGEEFAIVMPDADINAACQLAQRMLAAVGELREPHPAVAGRTVTVSIGVAAMVPPEDSAAHTLVNLADAALLRAKRDGRNRVVSAPHGTTEPRPHGVGRRP